MYTQVTAGFLTRKRNRRFQRPAAPAWAARQRAERPSHEPERKALPFQPTSANKLSAPSALSRGNVAFMFWLSTATSAILARVPASTRHRGQRETEATCWRPSRGRVHLRSRPESAGAACSNALRLDRIRSQQPAAGHSPQQQAFSIRRDAQACDPSQSVTNRCRSGCGLPGVSVDPNCFHAIAAAGFWDWRASRKAAVHLAPSKDLSAKSGARASSKGE